MSQRRAEQSRAETEQPLQMFYKKGILKNSAKFTGKHLCQFLFQESCNFIKNKKVATLLKRDPGTGVFL